MTVYELLKIIIVIPRKSQKLYNELPKKVQYNNEVKYYMVCLSKSELNEFQVYKEKSEIDILIDFLTKLSEVNNYITLFYSLEPLFFKKVRGSNN